MTDFPTAPIRSLRFATLVTVLAVLAGCGSKSGLKVPEPREDASIPDGGPPPVFDADVPPPPVDVCVELPPREPPEFVDARFVARIASADVLFLVDVTGSMVEEIEQIRRSLSEVIAPALAAEIPDVHLAVAELADFPASPYGDPERDVPFRMITRSTADVRVAQAGVADLANRSGNDVPESQVEALFQVATGRGIRGFVNPASCPAGTVGYPCFRGDGARIVLLFTDAEFHNGPGDYAPYERTLLGVQPASYPQAVEALNGIGAKVLGLYSGGDFRGSTALRHLEQIARDTGAVTVDEAGVETPLVVDIGMNGERLGRGVVDLVRTLVVEVPIDIDAVVEDWPGDAIDAGELVRSIQTTGARPADGAQDLGDRYARVRPGTDVGFRVFLANERIERGPEPQEYYLTVVLRGDLVTRLRETNVKVVIPSIDGRGCEETVD
ncbi:MAG: VWA domain-containing protein [Sandaracinus sp.]|nr:VWA domain-containing protein [Sandaracinus sp.]MCB9618621.1 VWA domain-containing protein [Sandaracinus sp.]MCB9632554.1 VWA domain-containing protein [Sandaracinus sp.]